MDCGNVLRKMKVSRKPSDSTQPSSKVNNHKGPSLYLNETNSLTVRKDASSGASGNDSVGRRITRVICCSYAVLGLTTGNLLDCGLGGVLFSPKWISSWNRHCSHYFYAPTRKLSGSFVVCSARWKSASS